MLRSTCLALLLLLAACATTAPGPKEAAAPNPRLANLQRAAALPWVDDGRCVVRESSNAWSVLVERCFHTLDAERIRFRDSTGRCTVASAGAATLGMGICILAAPEIVVGAVIITGVVVVAIAIQEEWDAYERRATRERPRPALQKWPTQQEQSLAKRKPQPEPSGQDLMPPAPPSTVERERSLDCTPRPVPHLGGDALHNMCADRVPGNGFPGSDVLVNGKRFDAFQTRVRVLWEVKTDNFDTYSFFLQAQVVKKQVLELQREKKLASACGFDFRVGVRNAAHKAALEFADVTLEVVVMDWC
ncbi:DUF6310 domain-containing protein [Corallococcus sp. BB11-1]|uniref:DUF6310 domain-containing protein n=1 Tax=Corallococcus sp. BB11-1 TaxID=2996783 RepID=UPI00226FEB42|nr:DUF6310 domain-containing protein [Corallococcus sp. BB11-1]MCY1033987.1 DUF6310 domain-containing protein [Corallococcus sp. BB11-1]